MNMEATTPSSNRLLAKGWRAVKKHPTGTIGLVLLVLILVFILSAGYLTPHKYDRTISTKAASMMSHGFEDELLVLGGDELGRDILTRLQHAGRTSFVIGLASPLLGVTLGTIIGIVSAYRGGVVDLLVQRVVDVLISLPGLVLAMAVTLALGFSVWGVIIALSLNVVGGSSRVVRSHALTQSQLEYVQAARALGASDLRIIFRHLLPKLV
jgi:peptide/nickel transport system permease protein